MDKRKVLIQNNKIKINTLLDLCENNYVQNINECNLLLTQYARFIKIIKITNIIDLYEWKQFISKYKYLKFKIIKDNKIINEISNIYSNTNSYYTNTQESTINILIHKYKEIKLMKQSTIFFFK